MKGWFQNTGLESIVNRRSTCGRKREFTKRGAEEAVKKSKNKAKKLYRYQCQVTIPGDLDFHWHLTSLPQRSEF